MLAVPPAILDLLHLEVGTTVALAVDGDRLVIQQPIKPLYSLDELLNECDADTPITEQDRKWMNLGTVGREL